MDKLVTVFNLIAFMTVVFPLARSRGDDFSAILHLAENPVKLNGYLKFHANSVPKNFFEKVIEQKEFTSDSISPESVALLLKNGAAPTPATQATLLADVLKREGYLFTSSIHGSTYRLPERLLKFAKAGLDINAKDKNGKTAYDHWLEDREGVFKPDQRSFQLSEEIRHLTIYNQLQERVGLKPTLSSLRTAIRGNLSADAKEMAQALGPELTGYPPGVAFDDLLNMDQGIFYSVDGLGYDNTVQLAKSLGAKLPDLSFLEFLKKTIKEEQEWTAWRAPAIPALYRAFSSGPNETKGADNLFSIAFSGSGIPTNNRYEKCARNSAELVLNQLVFDKKLDLSKDESILKSLRGFKEGFPTGRDGACVGQALLLLIGGMRETKNKSVFMVNSPERAKYAREIVALMPNLITGASEEDTAKFEWLRDGFRNSQTRYELKKMGYDTSQLSDEEAQGLLEGVLERHDKDGGKRTEETARHR